MNEFLLIWNETPFWEDQTFPLIVFSILITILFLVILFFILFFIDSKDKSDKTFNLIAATFFFIALIVIGYSAFKIHSPYESEIANKRLLHNYFSSKLTQEQADLLNQEIKKYIDFKFSRNERFHFDKDSSNKIFYDYETVKHFIKHKLKEEYAPYYDALLDSQKENEELKSKLKEQENSSCVHICELNVK